MKYVITNMVKRFMRKNEMGGVLLGRWQIMNCEKKTFNKVDRSNEDHCGTCETHATNPRTLSAKSIVPYVPKNIVFYVAK